MKLKHKFKAKPCQADNIKFGSKKERAYYEKLKILQKTGVVIGFLRQIPVHFSSGIKYVMDFLVFYADGSCEAIEVKGFETKTWIMKKKMLEDEYPWLPIKVVK